MKPTFLLFAGVNLFPINGGGNLIAAYEDEQSAIAELIESERRELDSLEWAQIVMVSSAHPQIRHHYYWDDQAKEWVEDERKRTFFQHRQKDYSNQFFLGTEEDDDTAEGTLETGSSL